MSFKFIALTRPLIGKKEINAVTQVLNSGMLTQGQVVSIFEKEFSQYCKVKYAIACNNGTSALHIALYSIGLKPGDEVITTPFTFVATANSILMVGAVPVFVDIEPFTFNIDTQKIEAAVTKKTKAILVVNLYGQPADYDRILSIAKKHNLTVVEDAAQSVGAEYKGKKSGNLADIGCFSFYGTKNITCGEGGMITTNNKHYYEKSLLFRNHGQDEKKKYFYSDIGYNYRLTDILASIALIQLNKIKTMTKKRQMIALKYDKILRDVNGITTPFTAPNRTHVYHQYTIKVTKDFKLKRYALKDYLYKKGVQTNIYYPKPLYEFDHLQVGKKQKSYPITEAVTKECLSLPIYPALKNSDIDYIIDLIKKI
ncbi:MAG: DegT/DnrJ/EryC1/StrS family aminotransferase [Candidatus Roizmanbacteria bacterium]|nr:MAG: DegT/DnrJ/EryC1/StrS family aminotransferase [Candidatus Roizmanbacteria bacterium]